MRDMADTKTRKKGAGAAERGGSGKIDGFSKEELHSFLTIDVDMTRSV